MIVVTFGLLIKMSKVVRIRVKENAPREVRWPFNLHIV